jgi:hypothetical protein
VQLFSLTGCVHVEENDRVRAVLLGKDDKGVHRTVGGLNINVLFDHFMPLQGDSHRGLVFSTQIQQQGIKVNHCVFNHVKAMIL